MFSRIEKSRAVLRPGFKNILAKVTLAVNTAMLLSFIAPVQATDGDWDTTFGDPYYSWRVGLKTGAPNQALAVQSDGKIIAVGSAEIGTSGHWYFAVSRLNTDGNFDTNFGTNGHVRFSPVVPSNNQTFTAGAKDVVIQSDGKIVAAGFTRVYDPNSLDRYAIVVTRLNSNGSFDTSFNSTGQTPGQIIIYPSTGTHMAHTVGLLSSGKIAVAGVSVPVNSNTSGDAIALLLNTDGTLDTNFGSSGYFGYDRAGGYDIFTSLAVQSNDKIVLTGYASDNYINQYQIPDPRDAILLMRLSSTGVAEYTTLTHITANGSDCDQGLDICLQADEKPVVVGWSYTSGGQRPALLRFGTNGSLDFAINMLTGNMSNDRFKSVAVQSDGKILAGSGTLNGFVARYNPNGTLDQSFGSNGISPTGNGGHATTEVNDLALQSDGKILRSTTTNTNAHAVGRHVNTISPAPVNLGINPSSGASNINQVATFNTHYVDADGATNINEAQFKVTLPGTIPKVFRCGYDRTQNLLYVRNDADTAWTGGYTPGTANTITSSSQGTLYCANTTVTAQNNLLTVNWSIALKTTMVGNSTTALYVADAQSNTDGWDDLGTWTVRPDYYPVNVSLSPVNSSSSAGSSVSFTAVYSDANGADSIHRAYLHINETSGSSRGVYGYYDSPTNKLYLRNEDNTAWLGGFTPGSSNVISNALGSLNCASTTVSRQGDNLTVNWNVTLSSNMAGESNLYLLCADASNRTDGWDTMGTWTVNGNSAPVNVSISPNAGSSAYDTWYDITSTQTDTNGADNIVFSFVHAGTTTAAADNLRALYDSRVNRFYLYADNGTTALGGFAPGSANVISNSQGSLDCSGSSVTRNGNTLTIVWRLKASSAWAGSKNVYLRCTDRGGLADGFESMGTWTIN